MYEEMTKEKIGQIVILISAEDGTTKAFVEDKEQFILILKEIIMDYKMRHE